MAPVIRISDDTFAMLQKIAQPLVDTPDTAIRRALGAYLERKPIEPPATSLPIGTVANQDPSNSRQFDSDSPPDLTHASFLSGDVDGTAVKKWNYLLVEAHARAFIALDRNLTELQRASEAHIRKGELAESGFKAVKKFGFSVQAVEANKAWAISLTLAKKFKFPISAEFRWQQKDGAAFPGEVGCIVWNPSA